MKMHFKRHLSTILSAVASVGVIFTAISTAKSALKAEKKDTIEEKIVCYIPVAVVVSGTIVCIIGSNRISKRQQASLIGMYTILERRFKKYTNKVKEHYGAKAHNQIMDEIIKEECNPPDIWLPGLIGYSVLVPNNLSEEEVTRTFYDKFSKRYFESTLSKVLEAEATLNRDYVLGGALELNNFL